MSNSTGADWGIETTSFFLEHGDIFVPSRDEQIDTIISLVPAERKEEFLAVDVGCGAGSLSLALLRSFPRCRVMALDGSPEMLEATRCQAGDLEDRLETRLSDLRNLDWVQSITEPVRCFVSSLFIHHLDAQQKRDLFPALEEKLEPEGALLIADIVEPVNEYARRLYASSWDSLVEAQALEMGSPESYRHFREDWNHFEKPDVDFDKPSKLLEQLGWLSDAGFSQVDCFWLRAGHAIYGGYRLCEES